MTADPKLALLSRLYRCKSLVWSCGADAACLAATWAFRRSWQAQEDADDVAARATHPEVVSVRLCAGQVVLPPGSTLTVDEIRAIAGDDVEIIRTDEETP